MTTSNKNRLYGIMDNIDAQKVNEFFDARISKDNPLAAALLGDDFDKNASFKRNQHEYNILKSLLNQDKKIKILDLGCGLGRWASNLIEEIDIYDGIDFSLKFINAATEIYKDKNNINFYHMSATNIDCKIIFKKYDLIILNGVCMYINDEDLKPLMSSLINFTAEDGNIYLQESVSVINQRLTLKNFPSKELGVDYNAIYRTPEEYNNILSDFEIITTDLLLNEETGARKETNAQYWFLKRKGNNYGYERE